MKVLGFVLPTLFLLTTPVMAAEYQGRNIDGRKLAAKAYYYATGGVYNVQVSFENRRATIYFGDGNKTTIRLRQRVITDPKNIEGFGKLGQLPLSGIFSVGLVYDNNMVGNGELPQSRPLEGLWKLSLESPLNNSTEKR